MDRQVYLANYCLNKNCNRGECDSCMYEKGRADATEELAEFVMIDFALLFTKEELIEQFNKYIKRMRCCRRCAKCEYDKSYTYPYKCTESGRRMTEESAEDRSCEKWSRK